MKPSFDFCILLNQLRFLFPVDCLQRPLLSRDVVSIESVEGQKIAMHCALLLSTVGAHHELENPPSLLIN